MLDADGIALIRAVDPHRHRRVLPHEIGTAAVDAFDPDRCHITNGQRRSVRIGAQDDPGQFVRRAFLTAGAHASIRAGDIARRIGIDLGGNGGSDFRHADIMGDQRRRGHLDDGFRRCDTADGGAGDADLEQAHDQLIRKEPQLLGADIAGDHHVGHPIAPGTAFDGGLFRLFRQGGDQADRCLHIIRGA